MKDMKHETNIDRAIQDVRSRLAWPVREEVGDSPSFEITSSPVAREHVISWPRPGSADPPRGIEVLHELVHALLAETVHHEFAGHLFRRDTPDEEVQAVGWACRAAADWFVDNQLVLLVPEEEKADTAEHFALLVRVFESGRVPSSAFFLLSAGLVVAEAVRFLGEEVQTGGNLVAVVRAFLDTPTQNPTVGSFVDLVNRLLGAYCDRRVRLVQDGEIEALEVYTEGGG